MRSLLVVAFLCLIFSCNESSKKSELDLQKADWSQIEENAKGSSVQMMMWQGDPLINQYMNNYIVPEIRKKYGIELKINNGQGNSIVKTLIGEIEANKKKSSIDICWINGETFYQLRQLKVLYGPFVQRLPNSQFINFDNPFIKFDFQQLVDGMECPWGNVQQIIIYDSLRTKLPPTNLKEIEIYVHEHPGRFTIPYEFTGITLLKAWMIELAEDKSVLSGPFDEEKYLNLSTKLWEIVNHIKSNFWRNGETFPESLALMHQMFANGELDFTMSNNDGEVDNKIIQNIFPSSAKAYVLESGTIQNSHYLGIPINSANKAAGMVVINFMISPEAQFQKLLPSVWGDGTILDINKLSADWQYKFNNIPERTHSPKRIEINEKAIQEPVAEYMIRLFDDFRKYVIDKK
ncbi:MAG: ABC transporter substrate-binding protein [Saprospiraceae bacterium]